MAGTASSEILSNVGAVLAALSGLSTAAFGLLDSSKAFWGGISNVGKSHLKAALLPFSDPLTEAVGDEWWSIVLANWRNGMPKSDQKSVISALMKLGLTPATAASVARASHVDPAALQSAAQAMASGQALSEADLNVLGRMAASMEAKLDAAFERAEQQYKNVSRCAAGLVAVALAWIAQEIWAYGGVWPFRQHEFLGGAPTLTMAVAVGLLAVPVAPVAKDLTSALSSAMRALKTAKAL